MKSILSQSQIYLVAIVYSIFLSYSIIVFLFTDLIAKGKINAQWYQAVINLWIVLLIGLILYSLLNI